MDSTAPQGVSAKGTSLSPERPPSRWIWISILALVLIAVGYYALARIRRATNAAGQASAAARPGVPVSATAVKRGDLNRYLTAIGTVTAFNTVTVKTRVDGQIVNVAFKEGQTVHQGDLLVEIDPHPYPGAAWLRPRGNRRKTRPRCATRKSLVERDRALYQQGVIAAQDFDNQQALVGPIGRSGAKRPGQHRGGQGPVGIYPDRRRRSPDASGCAWWIRATSCTRPIPRASR